MKIYGNKLIKDTIQNMSQKDRMAHSFLICGEKGLGKKTISDWLAALLVCESGEKPCFGCRSCHLTLEHAHPDIIYAEHSGKLGGFSVDTVRDICADAYIKPNNGDRKIYIFTDADKITVQAQNSLLKLIEEPPDHAYFIFTVTDRNVILETIRSRVITLSAAPLSREELMEALSDNGVSGADAEEAALVFGGNAGKCIEFIQSDSMKTAVDLTKKVTDCIINRDEYGILKNFTDASADKDMFRTVIGMLDIIVRDALALRYDPDSLTGCYSTGARELSAGVTLGACENMHGALGKAYSLIDKNVNIKLIASVLSGELTEYRQL